MPSGMAIFRYYLETTGKIIINYLRVMSNLLFFRVNV